MNTLTTLKRGDLVFFQYGCMHGSDFGTVIDAETTSFGTHYWVRKSDFSLTTVSNVVGVVTAKIITDYEGKEWMSARGDSQIGAYLVGKVLEA